MEIAPTDVSCRMLRDVEFFRSRLSKLGGAAGIGDHLVSVVNGKAVTPKAEEASPAKPESAAEKPNDEDQKT